MVLCVRERFVACPLRDVSYTDTILQFKKASNMNYGMNISCLVEEELSRIERPHDWTQADEAQAYDRCLKQVLQQNGRAWADGNIRIGDYILLSESSILYEASIVANCLFSRLRHPCAKRLFTRCML